MDRFALVALIIAGALLGSSTSYATTIDVVMRSTGSGAPLDALRVGDQVDLGIRIRDLADTSFLYFWIHEYDESVADFESGETVHEVGARACFEWGCSDGLRAWSTDLYESVEDGITKVAVIYESTMWLVNSNPLEPGLDGIVGGDGAHVRVTFKATGLGSTTLSIDAGVMGTDGSYVATGGNGAPVNARVVLNVVPEPSTSLSMLLGVTWLGWPRTVRRSQPALIVT